MDFKLQTPVAAKMLILNILIKLKCPLSSCASYWPFLSAVCETQQGHLLLLFVTLPAEQREQNRHQHLGSLQLLLVLQQLQDQSDSLPRHSAPFWSHVAALLRFPNQREKNNFIMSSCFHLTDRSRTSLLP